MRSLVLAILLSGCALEEGDSCEAPRGECTSPSRALVCVDGEISALTCRGENGCRASGDTARCDQSVAEEGDACFGGVACTPDRTGFLACRDDRFVRGANCPAGCVLEDNRASCDAPEVLPPLQ